MHALAATLCNRTRRPVLDLPRATLIVAAWMLGAGSRYQLNDRLDVADWLVYAAFLGEPTGLAETQADRFAGHINRAGSATKNKGWAEWEEYRHPRAITPAGEAELASLADWPARFAARLEDLAGYLPLANPQRCLYWYATCACWVAAEAAAGRRLTAAELGEPATGKICADLAASQRQTVLANLARLRAQLAT